MSLHTKGHQLDYLYKYKDGKILQGLKISDDNCILDTHFRFKPGQLNMILGHDNSGKTYFCTWYMLVIALKHGKKFCIWSGENSTGQIMRDMIQMISGKRFKDLSHEEIRIWSTNLDQYFSFVDNANLYTPKELLDVFRKSEADACLIDPYTALDRNYEWSDNYRFLNECRHFCNSTNVSIYVITHPISDAGRQIYPESHMWSGHVKFPSKDSIEGGKAFLNRCDDMIIIHRLVKHPDMKYYTMVSVDKIKDIDTGGECTLLDAPILAEYNYGYGFKISGVDALKNFRSINLNQKLWISN